MADASFYNGNIAKGAYKQGTVGSLSKDKFEGKFVDEWTKYLKESNVELDSRDAAAVLAGVLAPKDDGEVVSRV